MAYRATAKTEARRAETRERIVRAALDQLADGGYASASVQAVAARARVATGSVYRHFDSKAALFAEVFRRGSGREVAAFRAATDSGASATERVAAAAEAFSRRALASPTRAYALIAEPVDPAVEAERLAFRHDYRDIIQGVLEDGIAAGEFAPHDTETTAAALVGAIGEALVGPLSPLAGGVDRQDLIENLKRFCVNAIPRGEPK